MDRDIKQRVFGIKVKEDKSWTRATWQNPTLLLPSMQAHTSRTIALKLMRKISGSPYKRLTLSKFTVDFSL